MGDEFGDVPGRRVTGEGEQSREAQRALHVSAMEVKGGGCTGGTGTTAIMRSLWYSHTSGASDKTQVGS